MKTTNWEFALGDHVKDMVSGYQGVIISRSEYFNGCKRYGIQPPIEKKEKGKLPEAMYFDGEQLKLQSSGHVPSPAIKQIVEEKRKSTGGPESAPRRAADPKR